MVNLSRFITEETGQGLVEYALIILLISIVVIQGLSAITPPLSDIFKDAAEKLEL